MNAVQSRKKGVKQEWPKKVRCGRESVTVYRRTMPNGDFGFMVSNYADGKRRFDSYADEADALKAANKLARQLSEREVVAAAMTNEQAAEYAAAIQSLAPYSVSLPSTASTVAECLKIVGGLPGLLEAVRFYGARHKRTIQKRVSAVVEELLSIKKGRGASERYLKDLRYRLNRFAESFQKDCCHVTPPEIQEWLDKQKLQSQGYVNFRRVLHLFFAFAVTRGYAADNPVTKVENIKVHSGDAEVFTPSEMSRLLAAASPDFLPCLAIGAFAGLRSAEIERLEWADIKLVERCIVVGASRAKTAARRIVPIADNLAAWLAPYAERDGYVWQGGHDAYYEAQQATAAATEVKSNPAFGIKNQKPVKWKANALRHSYASYRFARTGDAGRVAGELGNSAAVIHRHYRELVKPSDGEKWFSIKPEEAENVLSLSAAAAANV